MKTETAKTTAKTTAKKVAVKAAVETPVKVQGKTQDKTQDKTPAVKAAVKAAVKTTETATAKKSPAVKATTKAATKATTKKAATTATAPRRLGSNAKRECLNGAKFARLYLTDSVLQAVKFNLVKTGIDKLNKKPVDGLTALGRKGHNKFDQYQPLSGIVDNWLVGVCRAGKLDFNDVKNLIAMASNAENYTSKLPPIGQQTKKAEALTAALHTYNQVIDSLQAMRLQSKDNTLKKLYNLGYVKSDVDSIVIALNQVAYCVRPGLMSGRSNIKKAITAIEAAGK